MSRRIKAVSEGRPRTAKPKVQPRHLNRPSMQVHGDGFLSVAHAAQLLDKSEKALRRLINEGAFPSYVFGRRLGRQHRFDKAALWAWMKEGRERVERASR